MILYYHSYSLFQMLPKRLFASESYMQYLREQLGRLGNTPYELANVELQTEGQPFLPSSLLNRMRREAVDLLQKKQGERRKMIEEALAVVEDGAGRIFDDGVCAACVRLFRDKDFSLSQ